VKPETVDGYEAGIKANLGRVLSFSAAAFYQSYKDVQIEVASPNPVSPLTLLTTLTNAGGAKIYGADLDITLRPVSDLTLGAKAEYLHSKVTNFPNAFVQSPRPISSCPPASLPAGCGRVGSIRDVSGNALKNAPKWTATFSADYILHPSIGDVTFSANVYITSSFFWDTGNYFKEPSYALAGGRIAWQPFNENLQLAVWGKNLFNKDYATGFNDSVGGILWGRGRTIGIEGSYKF
jgi:iron complex outermembrane receptor protein